MRSIAAEYAGHARRAPRSLPPSGASIRLELVNCCTARELASEWVSDWVSEWVSDRKTKVFVLAVRNDSKSWPTDFTQVKNYDHCVKQSSLDTFVFFSLSHVYCWVVNSRTRSPILILRMECIKVYGYMSLTGPLSCVLMVIVASRIKWLSALVASSSDPVISGHWSGEWKLWTSERLSAVSIDRVV